MPGVERYQRVEEVLAITGADSDPEAQAAVRGWFGLAANVEIEFPVGQTLVRERESGQMYWVPNEAFATDFVKVLPNG